MAFNRLILSWKTSITDVRLAYKSFLGRFSVLINYTMWPSNLFFCIQLFLAFFIVQNFSGSGSRVRVQGLGPGFRISPLIMLQEIFCNPLGQLHNILWSILYNSLLFFVNSLLCGLSECIFNTPVSLQPHFSNISCEQLFLRTPLGLFFQYVCKIYLVCSEFG